MITVGNKLVEPSVPLEELPQNVVLALKCSFHVCRGTMFTCFVEQQSALEVLDNSQTLQFMNPVIRDL